MPRKKRPQEYADYLVPEGSYQLTKTIVECNNLYKDNNSWMQKFLYLFEYIAEQNHEKENFDYINIHIETMAKILGVNNQMMCSMLKDAVNYKILVRDGKMKKALRTKRGKQIVYLEEGKSFGYKFTEKYNVVSVRLPDTRYFKLKTFEKESRISYKENFSKEYQRVLQRISIDTTSLEEYIKIIINNKKENLKRERNYHIYISNKESEYYNNSNKQPIYIIPFDGIIVPENIGKNKRLKRSKLPFHVKPYHPLRFERKEIYTNILEESVAARIHHYVNRINRKEVVAKRPVKDSRVYSLITNLNRELRALILLDGKKVAAIDIRNSQPLLASIIVRKYWLEKQGELPIDVVHYQESCEQGRFYDEFMNVLKVPAELRGEFKKDFFKKVFFSKVIEKENMLKDMFIERYPNVWKCICDEKGGLYSITYGDFAKKLQMVEATLIYDMVNVELIKMGINAFNIFDSIYVSSQEDYLTAEKLLKQAFNAVGVKPTFNLEYKEHINRIE